MLTKNQFMQLLASVVSHEPDWDVLIPQFVHDTKGIHLNPSLYPGILAGYSVRQAMLKMEGDIGSGCLPFKESRREGDTHVVSLVDKVLTYHSLERNRKGELGKYGEGVTEIVDVDGTRYYIDVRLKSYDGTRGRSRGKRGRGVRWYLNVHNTNSLVKAFKRKGAYILITFPEFLDKENKGAQSFLKAGGIGLPWYTGRDSYRTKSVELEKRVANLRSQAQTTP